MAQIQLVYVDRVVQDEAVRVFGPSLASRVIRVFERSLFPLLAFNDCSALTRIHLAVLRVSSSGSWQTFEEAISLAQTDWRDVLIAGGLANEDWRSQLRLRGIDFPTRFRYEAGVQSTISIEDSRWWKLWDWFCALVRRPK